MVAPLPNIITLDAETLEHLLEEKIKPLQDEIDKLRYIIDLYISPMEEIFSEDKSLREVVRKNITKRIQGDRDALLLVPGIDADLQEINTALDRLMHKRKPGTILERRLKRTDDLLVARKNEPIPFTEMKLLQGFKPAHNRQDMTKLGHTYEQLPDKYEVRPSSLGGKTIRLNPVYYNHLTQGGV